MQILIIGCGRVGVLLAEEMQLRGHAVTVVDKNPLALEQLGKGFKGKLVTGVGFDRDVLLRAGIERTDGLAAVTASDEANVVAARIGREIFYVPKVVARVYDPRQAEIYQRLGIQTISPVSWGVHQIADILLYSPLDPVFSLGSGEVDLVEAGIPSSLIGRSARDLSIPGEAHVIAISRGGHTLLASPETAFQAGDTVHLAALASSSSRLRRLLEP